MTKEAKEKILKIIEKNSRLTNVDIAVMLDLDPTDVATALKQMGYLINITVKFLMKM